MAVCFQIFKVVLIILTLVSVGTGYAKLYQLFTDIGNTFDTIGSVSSFSDVAWIPYLVVQLCTTCFVIVQIYCLGRELCEDNYMFKHCFNFCFVVTVLIYSVSVLPKSIINLIYHNYDVTIEEWWTKVADVFDSFLAGLTSLGFQVILYKNVIVRTLRSAGICKLATVLPITHPDHAESNLDLDNGIDIKDKQLNGPSQGCCLILCLNNKQSAVTNDSKKETEDITTPTDGDSINKLNKVGVSQVSQSYTKGSTLIKSNKILKTYSKGSNIIKAKQDKIKSKIKAEKDKYTQKIQTVKSKSTSKFSKENKRFTKEMKKDNDQVHLCLNCQNKSKLNADCDVLTITNQEDIEEEIIEIDKISNAEKQNMAIAKTGRDTGHANIAFVDDDITYKGLDKTIVKTNGQVCPNCGETLESVGESTDNIKTSSNTCNNFCCWPCWRKTKSLVNALFRNRVLCFIITMGLANIHLLVYVVEFIFIVCPVC